MAGLDLSIVANVTEPGDVVLLAIVFGTTLVVGLVLLGVDTVVGRVAQRRGQGSGIDTESRQLIVPPDGLGPE